MSDELVEQLSFTNMHTHTHTHTHTAGFSRPPSKTTTTSGHASIASQLPYPTHQPRESGASGSHLASEHSSMVTETIQLRPRPNEVSFPIMNVCISGIQLELSHKKVCQTQTSTCRDEILKNQPNKTGTTPQYFYTIPTSCAILPKLCVCICFLVVCRRGLSCRWKGVAWVCCA